MFRGGAAKEMKKQMQEQARSDSYKASMAEQAPAAPEPRPLREAPREFTEAQLAGGVQADQAMEYYKQDPLLAEALNADPEGAMVLRDALAEKYGSGANDAEIASFASIFIEHRFKVPPMDVVQGAPMEEEKRAA